MRHGHSDWASGAPDHERPLTDRGEQEARRMGTWLRQEGHIPDVVVTSSATRTRATARVACEAMRVSGDVLVDRSLYGGGIEELERALAPHEGTILVVGHNPTMESALYAWVDDGPMPDDGRPMPTAAVAVIDRAARHLVAWQRPGDLTD